jgi:BNR/Asp-box repeat
MATDRAYRQAAKARGLTEAVSDDLRRARGFTPTTLRAAPDRALERAVRRLEFPDMARAREAFRLRTAVNDEGRLPADALFSALRKLDSSRARTYVQPQVAGVPTGREVSPRALAPPSAGLGPGAAGGWLSLGPGNIGGRTRSLVGHPKNANVLWAGSVGGGVWRTDDGGQSWQPVDDFMANLAVTTIAIDPTNPNVLYAGTGEGFSNIDAIRGAGIFMTTDGVSWQQLASTTGTSFRTVNRLAVSKNGKLLLAATAAGIFRSEDTARVTWTRVFNEPIADIEFHPTDSQKAVAGGLRNGQAYYSKDGGRTWTAAKHSQSWGSGRVELAYAVRTPTRVYASVDVDGGQIWRSTDGGQSFTHRKGEADGRPEPYLGQQGWYGNAIWAGDPTDSNLVLVGGVDLWRSTDGGDTLVDISTWWEKKSAHADHHCIVADVRFNGSTNKRVYFGNDGGVFRANDVRAVGSDASPPRVKGWRELVNTYGVTQFYAGAGNADTGSIIGGAQDNGTLLFRSDNGSEEWTEMFGGDGGWCAADPTDPDVFYGEYVYLNIHRSLDGGRTSEYISGQHWTGSQTVWKPLPFRIPDAMNRSALFIAPFALDPNEPNRLLGGGMSLWRTNDAKRPNTANTGPTWRQIKPNAGSPISALAIARGKPAIVWVGHDDGQVFMTTNGTASAPVWRRVDRTGPQPLVAARYCTGITIDAQDHKTVYLTFGGYVRENLWQTRDAGATWRNLGVALPAAPVRALTLHPDNSRLVYAGTEVGVFASDDRGVTWSPTNEGPTNCSVDDLFWMDRVLVCVTHGRGMFKIDLAGIA